MNAESELIGLLSDSDANVRLNALRALGRAGLDVEQHAQSLAEDSDDKVKRAAIRLLNDGER